MTKLFVDDERNPIDVLSLHFSNNEWKKMKKEWYTSDDWVIVRNWYEAMAFLKTHPCPTILSLDNDIQSKLREGKHIAMWMIDRDLDEDGKYIPDNFEFFAHTQNPVARDTINSSLSEYLKFKANNKLSDF